MGECFLAGRSGGGTGKAFAVIHVDYPNGSTCTCTCTEGDASGKVLRAKDTSGAWNFQIPKAGTWKVECNNGKTGNEKEEDSAEVKIENTMQNQMFSVSLGYSTVPVFSYTGDYKIVDDNDTEITNPTKYRGNWKIRFLDTGTLTITDMKACDGNIDVFLVGGGGGAMGNTYGGGGAGGGYTLTSTATVAKSVAYEISIGAGGNNSDGGDTSAFGKSAKGGKACGESAYNGGDGGSGGGGAGSGGGRTPGAGGSDGNDGGNGYNAGGKGQRTQNPDGTNGNPDATTREFGEATGKLYAGGGGSFVKAGESMLGGAGGGGTAATDGEANTGGGGGGGGSKTAGGKGGSGIVIIRNHREVEQNV